MRRTKEETEISKLRILLAAEEEFCKRGYVGANIDAIAKAVGMTKGAIFWHYKSKAELFKATIRRATERVKAIFKESFSTPGRNVMERCKDAIRKIRKDKAFDVLITFGDAQYAGGIPKHTIEECAQEISEVFADAARYLEEAKRHGELRPKIDVRDILIPLTLFMIGFAKSRDHKYMLLPISEYIESDSVIDTLFAGLSSYQTKT